MIKKAIIGILAMGLVVGIMFGRDTGSYIRTMGKRVSEKFKPEMDLEFEVDRLRGEMEQLDPAINACKKTVMTQKVELDMQSRKVTVIEGKLDKQEAEVLVRRNQITSGQKFVNYTRARVEKDLADRLDRVKAARESLNREKKILMSKRDKLRANVEKLDSMKAQKKELEVSLAEMEAMVEQIKSQEAIANMEIDDSKVTKVRLQIEELRKQVEIRRGMLDAQGEFTGLLPLEEGSTSSARDVLSEVDEYFGKSPAKKAEDTEEILEPAA